MENIKMVIQNDKEILLFKKFNDPVYVKHKVDLNIQ